MQTENKKKNALWIYGDRRHQTGFTHSLNVLGGALTIAEKLGVTLTLVLVQGSGKYPEEISLDDASAQAVQSGADEVLILKSGLDVEAFPGEHARVLHHAVVRYNPGLFLFPLSDALREIAARTAVLSRSGMIADCIGFKTSGSDLIAVCPSYGGEILAELGFADSETTGFITVQPSAFVRASITKKHASVSECSIDLPVEVHGLTFISRSPVKAKGKRLETADIVVVGGAGLGNAEGFSQVRRLAACLGGVTGATRPPVLWHWTDDDSLIGQTGKTVKPKLLISVGTSGAVQYTAGISQAGSIIAINRDADAPIFQHADIGIVADAVSFLPLLIQAIQKKNLRSLADSLESSTSGSRGADFGSRLMQLRENHGLSREELAERSGHTPDLITEIETNRTTPSVGFLIKLSEILDVDPDTFLSQDERRKLSGRRAKEYTRRTGNYYYQSLTPGAENEHLRVFMVTIESRQTHKSVAYRHEGEEFIYVMEGKLQLTLNEKKYLLLRGESMKFNSETPHKLKSLSDEDTKCLVTLYTP